MLAKRSGMASKRSDHRTVLLAQWGALSEFLTRHVRSSRRQFNQGDVMDGISWSDLNEDEQSAIEMLAA